MSSSCYREPSARAAEGGHAWPRGRRGDAVFGVALAFVGLLATPAALLGLEAWGAQASLGLALVGLGLSEVVEAWGAHGREREP